MLFGFTSGQLTAIPILAKIKKFQELGCQALELNLENIQRLAQTPGLIAKIMENFKFVSLHTPTDCYLQPNLVAKIAALHARYQFNLIVTHPDTPNWPALIDRHLPVAVENLNNLKPSYKNVRDFKKLFDEYDVSMVLDINHCYSNDQSLRLVKDIYHNFKDRIKEIHISGYHPRTFHQPLFKARQPEIIQAIPDKNMPLIAEVEFNALAEIKKEYNYITNILK